MRREILDMARSTGFEGSILDLYQMANQGANVPAMLQAEAQAKQENMLVAHTPQEQQVGLREQQAMGNTDASMVFPDVPANTSFNTEGMRVPINISKVDEQGHLVQSYENVPPGIKDLPTGPKRGTVIETPAYQDGGVKDYTDPKKVSRKLYDLEEKIDKSLGSPMKDSFNYSSIPNYDVVSPQYQKVIDDISQRRYDIYDSLYEQRHDKGFDEKVEKATNEDPMLKDLLAQKKSLSSQYPTITRATEQPIDALRHTAAGYKTSKAIEDKVKNVPYVGGILDKMGADKLAGFVGSNLFGIGHEAMTLIKDDRPLKQKAKESYEDIYNNLMGSVVAASGKSEDDAMKTILSLEKQGKLKKGQVKDLRKGGYRSKYGKDPVTGTGKKPKGSGRRLYTDENPKDTVGIKFATPADARATVAKVKRVSKPYARKIQILTVGEQRAKVMGKTQVSSIFTRGKEALRRGRKKT